MITSETDTSEILFETAVGVVFYYDLPFGLRDLGAFNIILGQNMGTPGSPYYNDIVIQRVTVVRGNNQ